MTLKHPALTIFLSCLSGAALTLLIVYIFPLTPKQAFRFRPSTIQIGTSVTAAGLTFRVIDTHRTDGSEQLPAPAGSQYLVTKVFIGNNTAEAIQVIPLLHFYAKDDQGRVYNVTANPSGSTQLSGALVDGDSLQEEISFLIPADARGLHLYYEPGLSQQRIIRVALE